MHLNIYFIVNFPGTVLYDKLKGRTCTTKCLEKQKKTKLNAGKRIENLPNYTLEEISEHTSTETGIWVVFKDGVYDITKFIKNHPGGSEKISMAIGTSVEPFWNLYQVHLNDHVFELLEGMRIGNVKVGEEKVDFEAEDFYAHENKRSPLLKVNSAKPFNAETPILLLPDNYHTPNELFFIRNHLPVPKLNELKEEVEIRGIGFKESVTLSLHDLKRKYAKHEISSTVMCAGNRRSDMNKSKAVKGLMWGTGAISNATWSGVKLCDVLKDHGVTGDEMNGFHVLFQGRDKDIEGVGYEASIPLEVALDPNRDVLLAFEMNGKELPIDHGYPIRVIVPGVIGARQVKWLNKIEVNKQESESFWQRKDYKIFNPSKSLENADTTKAMAVQDYPVQSAICAPMDGSEVDRKGVLEVKGYALSGGGKNIVRVDVSIDGGSEWMEAELMKPVHQGVNKSWAWSLWSINIPLEKVATNSGGLEVICKATDSSHNSQPESDRGIWNTRGLLENKWSRINLTLKT